MRLRSSSLTCRALALGIPLGNRKGCMNTIADEGDANACGDKRHGRKKIGYPIHDAGDEVALLTKSGRVLKKPDFRFTLRRALSIVERHAA